MSKRDYYDVLGVSKDSDKSQIKKSYRKLAMQHHPDRNPDNNAAEEKFKEVSEAYSVLSDERKRATYDRYGHSGMQGGGSGGFGGFEQGFDPFDLFKTVFGNFSGGFGSFGDDIFGQSTGSRRQVSNRGKDLSITLKLSLEEISKGVEKKVRIKPQAPCNSCNGSGSKDGRLAVCTTCKGSGEVRRMSESFIGRVINITTCPECRGQGKRVNNPCPECRGSGLHRIEKTVDIHIPAGITNGQYLKLRDQGNYGSLGGLPGDLIVHFVEISHKYFTRHEDDILYDLTLSYPQAVLGHSLEVPTLYGSVKLNIGPGTQSGKLLKLKGKGIPHMNNVGQGDQLVRCSIYVPKKVSANERELLEKLDKTLEIDKNQSKTFFGKVKDAFS